NLVGQSEPTLLTTVSQIDPIRVNFPISETDYVKNPSRFKNLDARDLAWAKRQFPRLDAGGNTEAGDPGIDLVLTDGNAYPHRGVIVSANRQIDSSTGTITLQALIPNPDGLLRPGQFGRVRIKRDNAGHDVIVVPGASVNGLRVIDKGLAEGDRLVVDGVQKISEGPVVDPRPAPDASAGSAAAPGASAASAAGVKN